MGAHAAYHRLVAADGRNLVVPNNGEALETRMGWVPDRSNPGGPWIEASLAEHLVLRVTFPTWPAPSRIAYCWEAHSAPGGSTTVLEHLAITNYVQAEVSQEHMAQHARGYVRETFSTAMLRLWLPYDDPHVSVVTEDPRPQEDGTIWTPITAHFTARRA